MGATLAQHNNNKQNICNNNKSGNISNFGNRINTKLETDLLQKRN